MAKDKDTVYVDIDDEITGIIDKVQSSEGKVVALVLPKRASAFQSIVNMKLLKRAADNSQKHLVLITTEAGLLPLAGASGIHVAKSLTSKPEIPVAPSLDDEADEPAIEEAPDEEPELDAAAPVGALAGTAATADDVETVVLDDEDLPPEAAAPSAAKKDFKPKKDKKLAVPNFERFRLLLALGALGLILLIVGLIFALTALPKATISIKTDATNVDANVGLKISTTEKQLNPDDGTLPAKLAQQQKTFTQTVPTTGQKNNGNKASGNVSMSAGSCSGDVPADVPAGTGISANNQTYITQESVSFTPTVSKGKCVFQGIGNNGGSNIGILAQSGGSSFNVPGGTTFRVSGRSDVTASGSTTGGTDNIVQTVNQNDINNAKAKMTASDTEVKQALVSQLQKENYFPIEATFAAGTPTVTSSANAGDVANNVTVTQTVAYTVFGVQKNDLKTLVENSIQDQIDPDKQSILDDGINDATFNVDNQNNTGAQVTMSTKVAVGPDLDTAGIRKLAAGKKAGAIKSELQQNPDVTSVEVKLSPFWVSSVPKKDSKIKVEIAKPTTTKAKSSGNSE